MPPRLPRLSGLLVLVSLPVAPVAAQWVDYVDASVPRIVADEGAPDPVGLTDTFEKDLVAGDVDKDGDLDVLIARKVRFSNPGGKRNVLFMNNDGTFVDETATLAPDMLDLTDDRDIILVDVNGDTWLDAVTGTTFSDQPRVYMNLGEDAGGEWLGFDYEAADNRIPPFTPGPKFCAVVSGDIDNDLDEDLFFVDYDNTLEDRLLINDGNGFFTDETDTRMSAAMSQSGFGTDAQIVDMNGDGARDIVKLSTLSDSPNSVRILYNAGGKDIGTFDFMEHVFSEAPYMHEVGDLNNDDRPDIYVVDDNQDAYLINTGNDAQGHAEFTQLAVSSSVTTSFGGNVKLGDLDGDTFLDVVVADVDTDFMFCDRQPVALRNGANPPNVTLSDPLLGAQPAWMPDGTFDFLVRDLNGDGVLDLWAGTCNGNQLFLGQSGIFVDGFESGDTTAWSVTTN